MDEKSNNDINNKEIIETEEKILFTSWEKAKLICGLITLPFSLSFIILLLFFHIFPILNDGMFVAFLLISMLLVLSNLILYTYGCFLLFIFFHRIPLNPLQYYKYYNTKREIRKIKGEIRGILWFKRLIPTIQQRDVDKIIEEKNKLISDIEKKQTPDQQLELDTFQKTKDQQTELDTFQKTKFHNEEESKENKEKIKFPSGGYGF